MCMFNGVHDHKFIKLNWPLLQFTKFPLSKFQKLWTCTCASIVCFDFRWLGGLTLVIFTYMYIGNVTSNLLEKFHVVLSVYNSL